MEDNKITDCKACPHDGCNRKVAKTEVSDDVLYDLAEVFKVFGDKTRIRILSALSEGEMCVCCICEILGMSQSAVSHQLSVLKSARLIKSRREGKQMYYSLDDAHIGAILCTGISHVEED